MRACWLVGLGVWCACNDVEPPLPAVRIGTPCPAVVVREVNDAWIVEHPFWGGTDWQRSTYFIGNLAAAEAFGVPAYLDYTFGWANYWEFKINGRVGPARTLNAQIQTSGQVYLDLYDFDPDPAVIADIAISLDYVIRYSSGNDWSWAEAQFFAQPAFAKLGAIANNARYTDEMFALFTNARDTLHLFDPRAGLWFLDVNHVELGELNPRSFTTRANGMVMASVARTLERLPAASPYRSAYVDMLVRMAAAVAPEQRRDGLWNFYLTDPNNPMGPESSGSAFLTFALAWGIDHGVLDRATYLPVVERAWRGLVGVTVREDLLIGYVQPVQTLPELDDPLTLRDVADFGVGAFLLAGSEVTKLGLDLGCP